MGGFNIGGINGSGQIADVGNYGLIDKDTPSDVYTKKSYIDGSTLELVYSDEFNTDGRTFYPGDDPYWEAVDLHYWGTNNLEWRVLECLIMDDGVLRVILLGMTLRRLRRRMATSRSRCRKRKHMAWIIREV